MDFLIKDAHIAIEAKMTRKGLGAKKGGEQLIVDIANYKQHQNCNTLVCIVYVRIPVKSGHRPGRNPASVPEEIQPRSERSDAELLIR